MEFTLKKLSELGLDNICTCLENDIDFYNFDIEDDTCIGLLMIYIDRDDLLLSYALWNEKKHCWYQVDNSERFYRKDNPELFDKVVFEAKNSKEIEDIVGFEYEC